jgi:hypothetical protein
MACFHACLRLTHARLAAAMPAGKTPETKIKQPSGLQGVVCEYKKFRGVQRRRNFCFLLRTE